MQIGTATVENSMELPQKIKNGIPIKKNLCTSMFIAALFTITKYWKQPKCPSVDEWIKTLVHLHDGILHSRRKEGTPTFHDSMDGTGEYSN